jgi:hypothetical protein
MKFSITTLIIILNVFFNHLIDCYELKSLSQKIILSNEKAYAMLSDDTLWEVYTFNVRQRTWSEWWNGIKLDVPEDFITDLSSWKEGCDIILNDSKEFLKGDLISLSKVGSELQYCKFVFINCATNEIVFARNMQLGNFIRNFYQDIKSISYSEGYASGYNIGYLDGQLNPRYVAKSEMLIDSSCK